MQKNLFSPSYLKGLCEQFDLTPSKKYGQNYLISARPIEAMIEAGQLSSDDHVIEIGPGFGVLTFALLEKAGRVTAFEIEQKLRPYWDEVLPAYPHFDLIWGNALTTLPSAKEKTSKPYKVLANLPYQITSHALRTLLELPHPPQLIVVMVQKEVADRMCAKPGNMSLLSVSVQYFGKPRIVTKVPKGNFWPIPKVDSAVVAIEGITPQPDQEAFFALARAAFFNKRKQAWRNISTGLDIAGEVVKKALHDVTGNEKIRAEELSMEQWHALFELLT